MESDVGWGELLLLHDYLHHRLTPPTPCTPAAAAAAATAGCIMGEYLAQMRFTYARVGEANECRERRLNG